MMLIKTPLRKPVSLVYTDLWSFRSVCLSKEKRSRLKFSINSLPHIHIINSPTTLTDRTFLIISHSYHIVPYSAKCISFIVC